MLPTAILDRFVERCPAVVMRRATLERLLRPERLDQIFEQARQRQYCKQLLFSQVVVVMMAVATQAHKSDHAAYQAGKESLGVSPAALYDKINHIGKRPANVHRLSITHISGQTEADMYVCQPCDAPPEDHVAWWRVSGATKIAAKLCQSNQEVSYSSVFSVVFHWFEMFKQFNFSFGEHQACRQFRRYAVELTHP